MDLIYVTRMFLLSRTFYIRNSLCWIILQINPNLRGLGQIRLTHFVWFILLFLMAKDPIALHLHHTPQTYNNNQPQDQENQG